MKPEERNSRTDHEPVPAPEKPKSDVAETLEQAGEGVVNLFTVERDTSLADGAGAPGSTNIGGLRRDDRDRDA